MISNAELNAKLVQAHNSELALYTKRELTGTPAMLVGTHDMSSVRKVASRTRHGPARRASLWVSHNLAVLADLTGGKA
jgi:hypothetical protein